jgi:hypothetical protein
MFGGGEGGAGRRKEKAERSRLEGAGQSQATSSVWLLPGQE